MSDTMKALIAKASPERLKEIEAAIRDGRADRWTIEEAAAARAYLDRLQLSLDRELEKEMSRQTKAAPFSGFATPLPKGTSISEIESGLDKMKAEAAHAAGSGKGKEVTVPNIKVTVILKVIERTEICSRKLGQVRAEVVQREEVPVLVRSKF